MTPEQIKGTAGTCDTVKIKAGDSYAIINAVDFDPKQHERFEEQPADSAAGDEKKSRSKSK